MNTPNTPLPIGHPDDPMAYPPTDPADAATWLLHRHPWPRHLVARVVPGGIGNPAWLDDLVDAVLAHDADLAAWQAYETANPLPWTASEAETDRWAAAGPTLTNPNAAAIGVMSSGEARMVRYVATLHPARRIPFGRVDVDFDERGLRFVLAATAALMAPYAHAYRTATDALTALPTTALPEDQ